MIANNKIYSKKGNINYKERKLIDDIRNAIGDKIDDNFISAKNFSELEELHSKYAGEDIEPVEESTSFEKTEKVEDSPTQENDYSDNSFTDPFNRQEPIVRDYVLEDRFSTNGGDSGNTTSKSSYNEPLSFEESFELPTEEDIKKNTTVGSNNNSNGNKKEKEPPMNPAFDEMSDAEKRKSTKKMAKAIVEGVSRLAEAGSIWWVTKDITEDKVVEYEINDTMDLNLLLTLDEETQITVKSWFSIQVKKADDILRVSESEKADMVDSLYAVMIEKGIAPTPSQMLIINAITTYVIGLGVKAFAMSSEIKSVLNQLTDMRAQQRKQEREQERPQPIKNEPIKEEPIPFENNATDLIKS